MDDFDTVALAVRADTHGFRADVEAMRDMLSRELGAGADAAGRGIEDSLRRAGRSGRLELEDLGRAAAKALGEIAAAALGAQGCAAGFLGGISGLPGRATGGPVSPGKAYVVGERGPELFVPTASGRVETGGAGRGPVNIRVNVAPPREASAGFMAMTGRQVARDVRRAMERAGA